MVWPNPLITAGRGAFITDLLQAAGAESVTANIRRDWARINLESVLARQPEYLVLIRDSNIRPEDLKKLPGWSSLNAVREGKVIWADDRIYYPSPLMLDALDDLSRQLQALEQR